MKKIIVTAANEGYSDLLIDLLDSIDKWRVTESSAIGLLDVGLSPETREELRKRVDKIVEPDWHCDVDDEVKQEKPHLKAMTARPFLVDYFPGYDVYTWLDADTWVQNRTALDWLTRVPADSMGIVPEVHQSYDQTRGVVGWRYENLESYYPTDQAQRVFQNTYFNSGVFSLRASAPHWDAWQRYLIEGIRNRPSLICDQTALNQAIWKDNLNIHPLPALCNWCCHLMLPLLDKRTMKLYEPHIPYQEIGIIHLTYKSKNFTWTEPPFNKQMSFRYRALQLRTNSA